MKKTPNVTSRLKRELYSYHIDKASLRSLCAVLEERVADAANQEVQQMVQGNVPDAVFESDKQKVRDAFYVTVTVRGTDNRELLGTVTEVFDSPNFPDQVASFYANSSTTLRARYNYSPRNTVEMYLDFLRPAPLDFNWLPSRGTENESNYEVQGQNATWTNGLFHELNTFFDARSVPLRWVHRPSVWDAILWLGAFPLSLWACFRLAPFVNRYLGTYSQFLQAAAYVYIVLVCINLFRAGFHYTRWLWPRAEYLAEGNRALRHRLFLGAIALSIVGAFIYDILKIAAL
jgi:hypothetical protein